MEGQGGLQPILTLSNCETDIISDCQNVRLSKYQTFTLSHCHTFKLSDRNTIKWSHCQNNTLTNTNLRGKFLRTKIAVCRIVCCVFFMPRTQDNIVSGLYSRRHCTHLTDVHPYRHSATIKWVNPSKRGGMDGVFRGLAGLLRGISRGRSPREIPSF